MTEPNAWSWKKQLENGTVKFGDEEPKDWVPETTSYKPKQNVKGQPEPLFSESTIQEQIDELILRYEAEKKEVQECSIDNCEYDMDHRDHIHEETMIVGRLQASKELKEVFSSE